MDLYHRRISSPWRRAAVLPTYENALTGARLDYGKAHCFDGAKSELRQFRTRQFRRQFRRARNPRRRKPRALFRPSGFRALWRRCELAPVGIGALWVRCFGRCAVSVSAALPRVSSRRSRPIEHVCVYSSFPLVLTSDASPRLSPLRCRNRDGPATPAARDLRTEQALREFHLRHQVHQAIGAIAAESA